jgi:integrase
MWTQMKPEVISGRRGSFKASDFVLPFPVCCDNARILLSEPPCCLVGRSLKKDRSIYQGKAVNRDLSTTTVKRLVKNAAKRAGLDASEVDAFSGHSLRVGAAQDLLKRGFDTAAIMRAGGWKSINVLTRYLENAEHNVWI